MVVGFDRNINYYKIQYATLCIRENPGCMFIATNLGAWLVTWRSLVTWLALVTRRSVDVASCTASVGTCSAVHARKPGLHVHRHQPGFVACSAACGVTVLPLAEPRMGSQHGCSHSCWPAVRSLFPLFRFMCRCGDAPDRRAGVGGQRLDGGRHPR